MHACLSKVNSYSQPTTDIVDETSLVDKKKMKLNFEIT